MGATMGPAPVLTTARLILRPHTVEDFAPCCALWAEPGVIRFIGGRPSTPEEVWARLLRYAGLWSLRGYGYLLVTDRTTGALVGEVGLADFQRDITAAFGDTPEAGWVLLPQYHGKGLAREALQALLDWADLNHPRTVCMIDPANMPSLALAGRLGYAEYARATYKDHPTILFERKALARG
ncbi:GNAT family N-acetyltransferase [Devosia aquimaris]|uniref:GNAT family N-acetyltransferase n=1 Tax=Devosia aquimaris TaxID=2866214 RepID=UPI001CD0D98B|nr:GNAT family N-acetyltransferase [Devosia sp. CJK-A8-3]